MRVWRYHGFDRLVWIMIALLVLAVAVFVMATGFTRLRAEDSSSGAGAWMPDTGSGLRWTEPMSPPNAGRLANWESRSLQVPCSRARG